MSVWPRIPVSRACVPLVMALMALAAGPTHGASGGTGAEAGAEQILARCNDSLDSKRPLAAMRPLQDVNSSSSRAAAGVFKVHPVDGRIYYEIPQEELNREFLWVTTLAKSKAGFRHTSPHKIVRERVVRWERRGAALVLREVSYESVADPSLPVARAVEAWNYGPVVMVFDIEAFGAGGAPIIDVTRLFVTEVEPFSVRGRLLSWATRFECGRSFVESVRSFPGNIEADVTHTYVSSSGSEKSTSSSLFSIPAGEAVSVQMHYSMVRLPPSPMRPRLYDDRVSFMAVEQYDYGADEHRAAKRRYIMRYRLEKKDPDAGVSEPIKPIVFYLDPAIPRKWIPYIRQGVEEWQSAFEGAGFRNAVQVREPTTAEREAGWNLADARYSVIRWKTTTEGTAYGSPYVDPRTGEILRADITLHHNLMADLRDSYFVQAAPLDPRAQQLPLPDELMGQLWRWIVAHEVGHAVGFEHNYKSNAQYPVAKLRDPEWVRRMGHVPSVMDEAINYVAQPEDGVAASDLIPRVGPYDRWAVRWGYTPIPQASAPEQEKPVLHAWALEQEHTPWFRASAPSLYDLDAEDNGVTAGGADPILGATLGLKNLERVADLLLPATTTEAGASYDLLAELYERMLVQWSIEMHAVVKSIGGFEVRQRHVGQPGARFIPLPKDRQAQAVSFLNRKAFMPLQFAFGKDVLSLIGAHRSLEHVGEYQRKVLEALLEPARVRRVIEQAALNPATAYLPVELLADVRTGVWQELAVRPVVIDPYRRLIQRAHLDVLSRQVRGTENRDDLSALYRGELAALDAEIHKALPETRDRMSRLHLEDVKARIRRVLNPERIGS